MKTHGRGTHCSPKNAGLNLLVAAVALSLGLTACQMFTGGKTGPKPLAGLEPASETDEIEMADISQRSGSGLNVSVAQRFSDVPLPGGVKMDLERTFVYEDASLQIGRMVYSSRSSINRLAQFFIDECVSSGWKLDTVLQADGAELLFLKPGKRLRIAIRNGGMRRGGRLIIVHLLPDNTAAGASVSATDLSE